MQADYSVVEQGTEEYHTLRDGRVDSNNSSSIEVGQLDGNDGEVVDDETLHC